MQVMNEADHANIAAAIREAESRTSGEIYAVLARRSDSYFFVAGFMVACGILFAAVLVAVAAHWFWYTITLPVFGLAILSALVTALLVLRLLPDLHMWLVPKHIRYRRAHLNASQQFLARNVHLTTKRTGVLLFVSLAERYAEVVADAGINAKVGQQEWNDIVAILIDHAGRDELPGGFLMAIKKAGLLLEEHFPGRPGDINELDDHLVEL